MTTIDANTILGFFYGTLAVLMAILGWIGSRLHTKLDKVADDLIAGLAKVNQTLSSIERDLRGDLASLDRRITKLELVCDSLQDKAEDNEPH